MIQMYFLFIIYIWNELFTLYNFLLKISFSSQIFISLQKSERDRKRSIFCNVFFWNISYSKYLRGWVGR